MLSVSAYSWQQLGGSKAASHVLVMRFCGRQYGRVNGQSDALNDRFTINIFHVLVRDTYRLDVGLASSNIYERFYLYGYLSHK